MDILANINPRKITHILIVFLAGAAALFGLWQGVCWLWPDRDPDPVITLTPEQVRAVYEPIQRHADSLYAMNAAKRKSEMEATMRQIVGFDSTYKNFLTTKDERDEKINRTYSATDAELMQQWADRYGR